MPRPGLSTVLPATCDTMRNLALFPLELEADRSGASILAIMPRAVLTERSEGPYCRDRLPPEAVRLAELISLRWRMRGERPDLVLDIDGRRPKMQLELPYSGVRVLFVTPEDAPAGYRPAPGDGTAEIGIKLALDLVAQSVDALGYDVPLSLRLTYPKRRRSDFGPPGMPVVPTIELDRHLLSSSERKRHNEALRFASTASSEQRLTSPFGTRISLMVGAVRVRDA